MALQVEKLKEALQTGDQLNVYAEFCTILKYVVELSKSHRRPTTKVGVMDAVSIFKELRRQTFSLYEKLKDMNTEEILLELEKIEELTSKAVDLLSLE